MEYLIKERLLYIIYTIYNSLSFRTYVRNLNIHIK